MKTLKSSKILVALMATTVFMILPTVVMALTDTQTTSGAGNNALPAAANGNNGMNAGNPPIQANPAANNNPNQQSNMNAQRANSNDALVKSKNTPPNNPAGTNR
ncbi:MAG: hypothetical protein K0R49_1469 [Burkholderiales bacterium]|jgi:hypothetical protein|nr:hypothetical protein [Burkholderiales bacterium]